MGSRAELAAWRLQQRAAGAPPREGRAQGMPALHTRGACRGTRARMCGHGSSRLRGLCAGKRANCWEQMEHTDLSAPAGEGSGRGPRRHLRAARGPFCTFVAAVPAAVPAPCFAPAFERQYWLRIGAQGARAPQVQPGGGSVHCVLALTAFVCAPAGRAAPHTLRRCVGLRPGIDPGVGARADWFTHMLRYCTFNAARGLASLCPLVSPKSTHTFAHTARPPALRTARHLQPVQKKAQPAHCQQSFFGAFVPPL